MTAIISTAVAFLVGTGLGWYVKGRGWFGVKVDASNVEKKVASEVSTVEAAVAQKSN